MCVFEELFTCGHRGFRHDSKCHKAHCDEGKSTKHHYDCVLCDPERKSLRALKKQPSMDMGVEMKTHMIAQHGLAADGKVEHSKSAIGKETAAATKRSIEEARRSAEGTRKSEEGKVGPKHEKGKLPGMFKTLFLGKPEKKEHGGKTHEKKEHRKKGSSKGKEKASKRNESPNEDASAEEQEPATEDAPAKGDTPAEEAK